MHITVVIIGLLLPLTPVIASMAKFRLDLQKQLKNSTSQQRNSLFLSRGLGFRTFNFPPILCTGNDPDVIFYSLAYILSIVLAIGCTLLIIIFWFLHRVSL